MKPAASRRVLLIEDHAGIREALAAGLGMFGHDVIPFEGGEQALFALEEARPEVALVDLGLKGMSGVETIRRLRALLPEVPVLVLTMCEDPATVLGAIDAGAQGYLVKGTSVEDIARALDEVAAGLSPLSPAVARHLLPALRQRPSAATPPCPLTERERDVLELLVRGHSYADVATALGIGVGTVQGYVKNLYKKLEVSTKAEAAWIAVREGWIAA